MAGGETESALNQAAGFVKRFPDCLEGLVLLSQFCVEVGRHRLALDSARKAVALDRTDVRAMLQLGRSYQRAGFLTQATQAAQRATELVDTDPDEISSLGTLLFHLGEFQASIDMHRRASNQHPDTALYHYNLAISLQAAGELEQAEQVFLHVLALEPDNPNVYVNLSRIRKQTPTDNHVAELESLLAKCGDDWETSMRINYSLAKEYEDLGEYPRSFERLKAGADINRSRMDYDVGVETGFFDKLIECFPAGCFDDYRFGHASEEPIFVVGMPRSGTTLTEQIISSHSAVFAAGELRDFSMNLSMQAGIRGSIAELDLATLRRLLSSNSAIMGERYIEKTRPRTGHTPRFIDKLPGNSLLCGFIHWALPQAKIVLLDRHPVDVCFSNYKVLFRSGYNYSYSLDDLAEYYIGFCKLMDHWQSVIPASQFYRISYEELVNNQEEQSRALMDFCGLEWEEACLKFYNNREGVTTASLAQVRQPIYRTAVARWRHYENELRPLISRLELAGIDCS